MLKAKALTPTPSHEDLFLQRYDWLLGWALKLTDHDREQAEDLLHDAYIQFTFAKPEIQTIQNIEAYLYGMLRFMRLSQIRRSNRSPIRPPSIVEYDSAELSLRGFDHQAQIQMQDELTRVCHYACHRKETSKAGSVLILRFFHGYYPNEIAQILGCTRAAVSKWERIARAEARLFLENPAALSFLQEQEKTYEGKIAHTRTARDFMYELRDAVFRSRSHDCLTAEQIALTFKSEGSISIDLQDLAHVVSCQICLDAINQALNLPLLSERYPTDSLGKDMNAKGGGSKDGGDEGSGGGGATGDGGKGSGFERRSRQVFEHRPKELCVSVNGYMQGSQKISSDVMEQRLLIDLSEPIGFVEIISEQGIRLLFHVVELPPTGPAEQRSHIELSEGRTLDASLNFGGPWPTLQVVYADPKFSELESAASEIVEQVAAFDSSVGVPLRGHQSVELGPSFDNSHRSPEIDASMPRSTGWLASVRQRLLGLRPFDFGFLLRPGVVTAIIALILIGALLLLQIRKPTPVLLTTDLLQRSIVAEDLIASRADTVLHRTITLEERRVVSEPGAIATGSNATARLIAQRRIEIWQSGEKGITARRLYDEKGSLVAGDWRRPDGVQTLYHHGAKPQLQLAPEKREAAASVTSDNIWQLSPSAKDFERLLESGIAAHVEERGDLYFLSAESAQSADGVVSARLTLSKSDLHATELVLLVASRPNNDSNQQSSISNQQYTEYRFTETSFERRPSSAVAPSVFEPEPQLLGETSTGRRGETEISPSPILPVTPSPVVATPELEVEVLRLLNQIGADMGEQVSVARTSDNHLRIEGIVESDQRKAEILRALGPVAKHPAVVLAVNTVEEAVKRTPQNAGSSSAVIVERSMTTQTSIPADADLRRYFSSQGHSGAQLDEDVRAFTRRILGRSDQILKHSAALKRLAQQFSQNDLQAMDGEARTKFLGLLHGHAQALEQQLSSLQRELALIFSGPSALEAAPSGAINDDRRLVQAAEQLFEMCAASDRAIRSAFTISPGASDVSKIKSVQFFRAVASARNRAAQLGKY